MLASYQHEPFEAYQMIKQEEMMRLDDKLNPMINSHTTSGNEIKEETVKTTDVGGRPSIAETDPNKATTSQN